MKILSIIPTIDSARLIALCMEELGEKVYVTINPDDSDIRVRYGSAGGNSKALYNNKEFISLCTDKLKFSNLMNSNGIYSPIYFLTGDDFPEESDFPIMIRKSLNTTGGRGIVICPNMEVFLKYTNKNYYWTPFVKTKFELRVHVLGGKVIRIFKKIWEREEDEPEFPIRNNQNYHYSLRNNDRYEKISELVEKLGEILGEENFYAMDAGWDPKIKEYFVFELNSAPGLNEKTAEYYARFLVEVLGLKDDNRAGENTA